MELRLQRKGQRRIEETNPTQNSQTNKQNPTTLHPSHRRTQPRCPNLLYQEPNLKPTPEKFAGENNNYTIAAAAIIRQRRPPWDNQRREHSSDDTLGLPATKTHPTRQTRNQQSPTPPHPTDDTPPCDYQRHPTRKQNSSTNDTAAPPTDKKPAATL